MTLHPSKGTAVAASMSASDCHPQRRGIRAILWECSPDSRFIRVSESAQEILGYPVRQWLDEPDFWVRHLHPQDRDAAIRRRAEGVDVGHDFQQEFRMLHADGSTIWLHDIVTIVRAGGDVHLQGVMFDTSDRKAMELAIVRSEERLRRAQESGKIGTFDWNVDTNEVIWDGVEPIHGLAPGSFEGSFGAYVRDIHPDDRDRVLSSIMGAVERGEDLNIEYRIIRPDGSERWVEGSGRTIKDEFGRVIRVSGTCMDITKRVDAERATRFQAHLLDVVGDAVIGTDLDGSINYWNRAAERLFGWTAGEIIGANIMLVNVPGEQDERARKIMAQLQEGESWSGEFTCRARDGTLIPLHVTNTPVRDESGRLVGIIGVSHDISERIEAEHALETSERTYRCIANAVPAMISLFHADGTPQFYNDRWYEYTGLAPNDTADGGWRKILDPAVRDEILEQWRSSLRTGEAVQTEARLRRADGLLRWHLGRSVVMRGADGVVEGFIVAAIDIHDRRVAEERIAELNEQLAERVRELDRTLAELRRASQAKDEFLGLVSHELRTPITTIFGNAQVLRRRADLIDEEHRAAAVADIEQEADRLHRIVENMLVLARIETGRAEVSVEPILLHRVVHQLAADHRQRYTSRSVELRVPADAPPVLAEPGYLEQTLKNLLSNAEKYSPPRAPIEIEVSISDGFGRVRVLDRGVGIAEDEAENIFNTFYRSRRTSETASGAGIGLAVCKRLIEAQSGHVWARPRDGGGAEVGFALPCTKEVTG